MESSALSESGLVDTLEPCLFKVCVLFEQAFQGMSQLRAVLRWEVLWASKQLLLNLPVEHFNMLLQQGEFCFV